MKKKLFITGVSGLLGSHLAYVFRDHYDISGIYHTHEIAIQGVSTMKLDLLDPVSLKQALFKISPDVIIHCAAQADVDVCEMDPALAKRANVEATQNLVELSSTSKLIYISTDQVYSGEKGHFSEQDPVLPQNLYGQMKCEAEKNVSQLKRALILRTNFFGWNVYSRRSIGYWILWELSRGKSIKGFKDAIFSSLYTFDLAYLLDQMLIRDLQGTYNLGTSTSLSKYDFAVSLARKAGFDEKLVTPVFMGEYPLKAKRAKNLSLDVSKLARDTQVAIPTIEECIDHFVRDYQEGFEGKFHSFRKDSVFYPELDSIPYSRQAIDEADIQSVVNILKSRNLTQGPTVQDFERSLCSYTGAQYAVAVNSGTSALHIACLAAGLNAGDEGVTTPITFVASANCMAYCGAKPIFADIDEKTHNISPSAIDRKMTAKTAAVIPVHFAGQSCDMEKIRHLVDAKQKQFHRKIYLIEDASHALGSLYQGHKVGSCHYSDMTVMSFHPVKHITTGEGGAILTNDKELYLKLRQFRSHGITSTPEDFVFPEQAFSQDNESNIWYYEQQRLGFNYRITDLQCALGVSQMKKLDKFIRERQRVAKEYHALFANRKGVKPPYEDPNCVTNWHLYVLNIDFKSAKISRIQLMKKLKEEGIQTQVHYIPVHTQPFYQKTYGYQWGDYPLAEQYYEQCLSIPFFPLMTKDQIHKVGETIFKILNV